MGFSPEMLQGQLKLPLSFESLLMLVLILKAVGIYLTNVARRAAEWPQGTVNPSPLIIMACTLIQHNKAQSRVCIRISNSGLISDLGHCSTGPARILGDTSASDVNSLCYQHGKSHACRRDHLPAVPQSHCLRTRQRCPACQPYTACATGDDNGWRAYEGSCTRRHSRSVVRGMFASNYPDYTDTYLRCIRPCQSQ